MKMLRRLLAQHVELDLHCSPQPLPVHADPSMLDQVLINLAVNARDAMTQGGRIRITTSFQQVDAAAVRQMPQAREGPFVCLAVSDTGSGISPEVLPRVFEPFFTTKGVGKGTGLGLATVHGIVEQHNGWVTVESTVGQGTTFRVFLPRVAEAAPHPSVPADVDAAGAHSETILVAEDEAALRDVLRKGLVRMGYRVHTAPTGAAAITEWEKAGGSIDVLVTDIVMPDGMTGWELAKELRARRPELRVICISGYSAGVPGSQDYSLERFTFLQKPFPLDRLIQAVRVSLDAQ
jgi:CheY-like chemotaxis protein